MRTLILSALAILLVGAFPVIAHHAAEGIIDDDIWLMIDELVADTPHGSMTIEDLGSGMMEATISVGNINDIEEMVSERMLRYVAMLDGDVTLSIDFSDSRNLSLTIDQQLPETGGETLDKALSTDDRLSWDELKANYR